MRGCGQLGARGVIPKSSASAIIGLTVCQGLNSSLKQDDDVNQSNGIKGAQSGYGQRFEREACGEPLEDQRESQSSKTSH
ncbi:hypothetical protein OS493_027315 [Desmophyllum pertusum]|uniref:Uncharacterized protein n=1 Tax=Desmophyllum pertusum TaxID=174260 RepID=A0A9X0CQ07_9CNID|nr:hypothetical protein OS493_027315 [Desmophyllum pertusum]